MARMYGAAIKIMGARSKSGGIVAGLSAKKSTDFIDATVASLDALKRTAAGAGLLEAIDGSGHVVTIYRTWDAEGGNCEFGEDVDDSMVVPLDARWGSGETELARVLDRATADVSKRSRLQKFFGVGRMQPRFLKLDAVARLVGTTESDLKRMAAGKLSIPQPVDSRLRSHLYDFLTPGPGSDCGIRFNHLRDKLSEGHRRFLPQSDLWENRPPAVALGHELIHAWRCMVGRVIFPYGWEEEAMTVGLPPFSNMPFTENRIRVQWGGLAVRGDYQNIDFESGMFDDSSKIGITADKKWMGKEKALAVPMKERSLAEQLANRRAKMGYDDEDDGF